MLDGNLVEITQGQSQGCCANFAYGLLGNDTGLGRGQLYGSRFPRVRQRKIRMWARESIQVWSFYLVMGHALILFLVFTSYYYEVIHDS